MRNRLILCLILGIVLGLSLILADMPFAQTPQRSPDRTAVSITTESLSALTGENWDARRSATEALRNEHRKLIDALVEVVEKNDEEKLPEARAYAASLLGEWHAISAIPVLMKHLDYQVLTVRRDVREFNFEAYPCAAAISEMGPTALKPMLAELAKRKTDLKDKEVPVAAYLVVGLCGDSKQAAIDALLTAEYKFDDSLALVRTRTYIENSMGKLESLPRLRPKPAVAP